MAQREATRIAVLDQGRIAVLDQGRIAVLDQGRIAVLDQGRIAVLAQGLPPGWMPRPGRGRSQPRPATGRLPRAAA